MADEPLVAYETQPIPGANGQVATVVELTNQGAKARAKGEVVLPAPLS